MYPDVHKCINDVDTAFGRAHEKCRITFSTKSAQYRKRYGEVCADEKNSATDEDEKPRAVTPPLKTRSLNSTKAGICFVCTERRICDESQYDAGGLRKLSQEDK